MVLAHDTSCDHHCPYPGFCFVLLCEKENWLCVPQSQWYTGLARDAGAGSRPISLGGPEQQQKAQVSSWGMLSPRD